MGLQKSLSPTDVFHVFPSLKIKLFCLHRSRHKFVSSQSSSRISTSEIYDFFWPNNFRLKETHMWFNVDDAHPSSFQHLIDSISAGPVQVTLILPVLHKPEHTHNRATNTNQMTVNGSPHTFYGRQSGHIFTWHGVFGRFINKFNSVGCLFCTAILH